MAVRKIKENIGKYFACIFFSLLIVISTTTNSFSKWNSDVLIDFVGFKSEFKTKDNISYMNYKLKKMLADSILKTKNSLYFEVLDNLNLEHINIGTKEPILNAFQIDYLLKIKRYTKCQGLFTKAVIQGVNPYLFLSKETLLKEKNKIKSYYLQAIANREKNINWDYYNKMLEICFLDQKFRKNVTPENKKNVQFNKRD